MYEVLFGFIFLSSVVRLHSCTYSLLPLDVCSCKTALSWPVLLHISTIATCCYLLLLISFIAYVVCHYLCHLLACIFVGLLSLFVPSTGVYFHMSFVTICAIYWRVISYVVCYYLCHLLACIFICRLSLFVPSTGVYFHMSFVTICAIYWRVFSYVVCHYLYHLLAWIFICILSLFVPSTGVNFHMSFITICAIYWRVFSYVALCQYTFSYIAIYCSLLPSVAICSPQAQFQMFLLFLHNLGTGPERYGRDEKACDLYVQCQWSLTSLNCKWALGPNNRATRRT